MSVHVSVSVCVCVSVSVCVSECECACECECLVSSLAPSAEHELCAATFETVRRRIWGGRQEKCPLFVCLRFLRNKLERGEHFY